ncbi:MAG: potassium channel protein [Synechococcales bacterium]|nr:potassium channel protein [Synechococcales bacterium]
MQTSLKRVLTGISFFCLTIIVAIAGYVMAGWTVWDATYMVVITIFGVGYGEVQPINTPQLRLFTMFVIIAGTSSAVYAVGGLVQMMTEGEIKRALGVRRMNREIDTLQEHVIVCGYGRMGQILTRELAIAQMPFIVIDCDEDRIAQAETFGFLVRLGSAMDEEVLNSVGIARATSLATVLPDDAANVFITLTARGLNPRLTILARGELPSTDKKLRLAGADRVISPAAIGAQRMARMITHPLAVELLENQEGQSNLNELLAQIDVQVHELVVNPQSGFAGQTIGNLEIRGRGAFIIVALRRREGELIRHPGSEVFLHRGDTLILLGHRNDMPQFIRSNVIRQQVRYRGAKLG